MAQPIMPAVINKIILDWEKKLNRKLEVLCMNSYEIIGGDGDLQLRALNFNVYIKKNKRYRRLKSKQSLNIRNSLSSVKKNNTMKSVGVGEKAYSKFTTMSSQLTSQMTTRTKSEISEGSFNRVDEDEP
jgi:hypothetical protein